MQVQNLQTACFNFLRTLITINLSLKGWLSFSYSSFVSWSPLATFGPSLHTSLLVLETETNPTKQLHTFSFQREDISESLSILDDLTTQLFHLSGERGLRVGVLHLLGLRTHSLGCVRLVPDLLFRDAFVKGPSDVLSLPNPVVPQGRQPTGHRTSQRSSGGKHKNLQMQVHHKPREHG